MCHAIARSLTAPASAIFGVLAVVLGLGVAGPPEITPSATAGEANVVNVQVRGTRAQGYRIEVTVRHADEGWEHYADAWEVLSPEGEVLATRTLYHPHVDEQPFTRSLSGVRIPEGIDEIVVRARDSRHGYGGKTLRVKLP